MASALNAGVNALGLTFPYHGFLTRDMLKEITGTLGNVLFGPISAIALTLEYYDQRVRNYTLRLTWQINEKNKLTVYDDYQTKYVGHLFTSGQEVQFASARRPPVLKYTDAIKWTSTVSNKLVFDAGYGTSVNAYTEKFQPGIKQDRFSPTWYTNVAKQDITLATTTGASTPETGTYNFRYMVSVNGGPFRMVRDFSQDATFFWSPELYEHEARIRVTVRLANET